MKEERYFTLHMVKRLKATGCGVLLLQKSILREAISEMGEHYLAKAGIMLVKDIDRDDIEFISRTLACNPVAHIDHLTLGDFARAATVEEVQLGSDTVVMITRGEQRGGTATVLLRGSNKLVQDEAERSLHDALCAIRCLTQKRFIGPGGAACEIEVTLHLNELSKTLRGMESYCVCSFAEALD